MNVHVKDKKIQEKSGANMLQKEISKEIDNNKYIKSVGETKIVRHSRIEIVHRWLI